MKINGVAAKEMIVRIFLFYLFVSFTCHERIRSLKQTALGKDFCDTLLYWVNSYSAWKVNKKQMQVCLWTKTCKVSGIECNSIIVTRLQWWNKRKARYTSHRHEIAKKRTLILINFSFSRSKRLPPTTDGLCTRHRSPDARNRTICMKELL